MKSTQDFCALVVYSVMLLSSVPLCEYIMVCLYIHLFQYLYCSQFGAIVNETAKDIFAQVFI